MTSGPQERDNEGRGDNVVPLRPPPPEPSPPQPREPPPVIEADIREHPWTAPAPRRPIIPVWLRSTADRGAAARWLTIHVTHTGAFHLVRVPRYLTRCTLHSPRGFGRAVHHVWRWTFDREAHPLRVSAVEARDPKTYTQLARIRKDRVRIRLATLAAAITGVAVTVLFLLLAYPSAKLVLLVAAVGGFGWFGRPAGRPYLEQAVVAPKAERLTPDVIIRALGAIRLAGIDQVLRDGGTINFVSPVHRDGPGWRADLDLPYGVTVTDVTDRREQLASGLRRPLSCVWPEPVHDEHAGRLVLWVGDQALSKMRQPSWPLLKAGRADLFKPVPFGTDQRQRPVSIDLVFNNMLFGAIPRQGKTQSLRVLLLAAALDPTAELRVFELKGTGDLAPIARVAHHYGSGPDDETIERALASVKEVYDELERRAKVIRGLPKDICPQSKITPDLARDRPLGLHPLVLAIDEAQEAFTHPEHGAAFDRYCTAIIKRGPAVGIIIILATQRPDAKSLPVGIRSNVSLRFCLRVMDQPANDMVLGTSAYKTGIRATLMTVNDKGCGYLVGAAETAQVVRVYDVGGPAAERICDRARHARIGAGTLTGHAAGQIDDDEPKLSLLQDIAEVVAPSEGRIWSETVCARLTELRPGLYAGWDQTTLANALNGFSVGTSQVWGQTADGKGVNRRGFARADVLDALRKYQEGTP